MTLKDDMRDFRDHAKACKALGFTTVYVKRGQTEFSVTLDSAQVEEKAPAVGGSMGFVLDEGDDE